MAGGLSVAVALFLDRDGVLNQMAPDDDYIRHPDDLVVLPGVGAALAALRRAVPDLRIAIATNQRGVALGLMTEADVDAVNARLRAALAAEGGDVDRVEVCPHDGHGCDCRKPAPGMLVRALAAWPGTTAITSAFVGDSTRDVVAGAAIGARTFLVGEPQRRRGEAAAAVAAGAPPDEEADSLPALVADGRLIAWLRDGRIVPATAPEAGPA